MRHICTHQTHISPYLQIYIDNLFSATRQHHLLDASLLSAQCVRDMSDLVKASQVVFGIPTSLFTQVTPRASASSPFHAPVSPDDVSLDCTDLDVTRILPGVLTHRLATRKSTDGVMGSLARTAVRDHLVGDQTDSVPSSQHPTTVHEVLAEILREV